MNELTQLESEDLLAMKKISENDEILDLPDFGGSLDIRLLCLNKCEEFILNYTRSQINLLKRNHHFRGRKVIGLARLDLEGPPHRNPDGQEIGPNHLHLYREGFGLKWAFDIPTNQFSNLSNTYQTLEDRGGPQKSDSMLSYSFS